MFVIPVSRGLVAVINAMWEGLVTFVALKQSSNRTPRAARASRAGVSTSTPPPAAPRWSARCVSEVTSSTVGGESERKPTMGTASAVRLSGCAPTSSKRK